MTLAPVSHSTIFTFLSSHCFGKVANMKISLIATAFFWTLTVLHADVVTMVEGDDPPVRWSTLTLTEPDPVGGKTGIACPLGQVEDSHFTLLLLSQDWSVVEDHGLDEHRIGSVATAESGPSNVIVELGPVENLAKKTPQVLDPKQEPKVRSP
jgi:hypothetical protein